MKIAIAAYVDHMTKFVNECNLMTYSGRGLDGRFTFVIYAEPAIVDKIDVWPNVKVIPYSPPKTAFYETYRFSRSIVFPYDHPEPLDGYDYVCKTDTDVMFTPKMNDFPFHTNKIYAGFALYSANDKAVEALKNAAIKWGYPQYKRIGDMHSTIIAPKDDLINIMKHADKLEQDMYYGLEEPGEWLSDKLWRGYYDSNSGICSMYATEIVISSLYDQDRIVITDKIDAASTSDRPWTDFYHFHHYHHNYVFSKFQHRYGSYIGIPYAIGKTSADYCLNTYLTRQNHMTERPEFFKNHDTTIDPMPPGQYGPIVEYQFQRPTYPEVWEL